MRSTCVAAQDRRNVAFLTIILTALRNLRCVSGWWRRRRRSGEGEVVVGSEDGDDWPVIVVAADGYERRRWSWENRDGRDDIVSW